MNARMDLMDRRNVLTRTGKHIAAMIRLVDSASADSETLKICSGISLEVAGSRNTVRVTPVILQ